MNRICLGLLLLALFCSGCANSPFFADKVGVSVTGDADTQTAGVSVSVDLAPNPNFKLPKGFSK